MTIALLAIPLVAIGYLIRDGFPALGSTHLARLAGGLWCIAAGALAWAGWHGCLLGLAIYAGFYSDMEHGEGHRARGWVDVPPLAISGVTSLLPLALVMGLNPPALLHGFLMPDWLAAGVVLAAGLLLKPVIWFAAWEFPYPVGHRLLQPTRMAAIDFGAVIGALIVFV